MLLNMQMPVICRSNIFIPCFLAVTFISVGAVACAEAGPSDAEVQQIVDQSIATAIASVPTVTPAPIVPTATRQPLATPVSTATPQPTVTPQPTPTRITFPPTATPPPAPKTFSDVFNEFAFSVFRLETPQGMGTGWLIEPGLILTNQHVVAGADIVSVRQNEGSLFTARVTAVDQDRDIALLSFNADLSALDSRAKPLPIGKIYTSDIASSLMAMGYSGGLTASEDGTIGPATANIGVLSSLVRFIAADVHNLVIDAAVDPGDSGGPVLNLDGEVVGMTRAAQTTTGSGQRVVGTFFAVQWNEIQDALPDLKKGISR